MRSLLVLDRIAPRDGKTGPVTFKDSIMREFGPIRPVRIDRFFMRRVAGAGMKKDRSFQYVFIFYW